MIIWRLSMQRLTVVLFLCVGTAWPAASFADLLGRLPKTPGGTDYQVIYDSDQNISWLANAKAGQGSSFDSQPDTDDGLMSWGDAVDWAESLNINGHRDWRLPITSQPDMSCSGESEGPAGEPVHFGENCIGSELGYLFYVHLGVAAGSAVTSSTSSDLALFSNLEGAEWWSSTYQQLTVEAWNFRLSNGWQGTSNKSNFQHFAWAVHDGDVGIEPPKQPESPTGFETR
jgi:hypothetical protein